MADIYNESDDDDEVLAYSNKVDLAFGKSLPIVNDGSESSDDDVGPVFRALSPQYGSTIGGSRSSSDYSTPSKQRRRSSPEGNWRSPTPPPATLVVPKKNSRRGIKTKQKLNYTEAVLRLLDSTPIDSPDASFSLLADSSPIVESVEVKIRIHGCISRHKMLKHESFGSVMNKIATAENATPGQICLNLREKPIAPTDTPMSLHVTVADIVECLVLTEAVKVQSSCNNITVKIQAVGKNSTREYHIDPSSPLETVLTEYCKDSDVLRKKCTFYFDGYVVDGKQSMTDIDAEDGDVIDVRIS